MSPNVAHAALGPDKSLSMGEVSLDMACSVPDHFEEYQWRQKAQWTSRRCGRARQVADMFRGECEGEVVGGTCTTHASACGQHDELEDKLTHLVYP